METITYIIPAIIIGIVIGWLAASLNVRKKYSGKVSEIERQASSALAVAEERAHQISKKEAVLQQLQDELDAERQTRVEAVTRLEDVQKNFAEELKRFREIEEGLKQTFKSISLDALAVNSQEFLKLAETRLKEQAAAGEEKLEGKKELIDQSIRAIDKTLSDMKNKIEDVGKGSVEISTLIKKHEEVSIRLKDTTEHLSKALASSKKRGEWGERMAEDIIRLVGLVEGLNYIKQKTLETSSGRPDYTFLLPNSLKINMDVKFPLDNYMHYLNAETDHDRKRYREELIRNTKTMIRQVTTRDYINPSDNTVDYVLVFIPNEQVYGFINETDPTIMDEALKQKAILCSPFTLYAVLAVIRQAIENFNLEQTASEILKLLGDFSKQWNAYKEKFRLMGERLDAAKKEYDAIVTTRTNMLERPLKKIDELRKQKSIGFDEEIRFDETSLL